MWLDDYATFLGNAASDAYAAADDALNAFRALNPDTACNVDLFRKAWDTWWRVMKGKAQYRQSLSAKLPSLHAVFVSDWWLTDG